MEVHFNNLLASMQERNLDAYLVPSWDEWHNEFVIKECNRLQKICAFSGSNGFAIITCNKQAFFTDGRYTLQAKQEVSKDFEILDYDQHNIIKWLNNNLSIGANIGFDGMVMPQQFLEAMQIQCTGRQFVDSGDLIGVNFILPAYFYSLPLSITGMSVAQKLQLLWGQVADDIECILVQWPDSICWLLNIRSNDIPYNPVIYGYALVFRSEVTLYVNVQEEVENSIDITQIRDIKQLHADLSHINGKLLLPYGTMHRFFSDVTEKEKIVVEEEPIAMLKMQKNPVELQGFERAHVLDGVALTKFLFWMQHNYSTQTEYSAAQKLLEFRKHNAEFIDSSFETISGYGANGAIVHYRVEEGRAANIGRDSLYLVDSGGHYDSAGTTDVTRTMKFGIATMQEKMHYTLVLRGFIDLMLHEIMPGESGMMLDSIARKPLKDAGFNYSHGTGHGVGHMLNVHEGAFRISPNCMEEIKVGMVLSNEPGVYFEGRYGIRIENLMYVYAEEKSSKWRFRNLTMAPLDIGLIDETLLEKRHVEWIDNYHREIYEKLSVYLSVEEQRWLASLVPVQSDNMHGR